MNERLATARIIHMALLAPPILLMGIFYFLPQSEAESSGADPLLLYVAIAFALAAPVMSGLVSRQLFASAAKRIREDLSLDEQTIVLSYQAPKIVQWALLEGPAMFQAVIFFLTGEIVLLGLGGLLLALLAVQGPSMADLQKRLEISDNRLRQIQAASS